MVYRIFLLLSHIRSPSISVLPLIFNTLSSIILSVPFLQPLPPPHFLPVGVHCNICFGIQFHSFIACGYTKPAVWFWLYPWKYENFSLFFTIYGWRSHLNSVDKYLLIDARNPFSGIYHLLCSHFYRSHLWALVFTMVSYNYSLYVLFRSH